MDNQRLMCVFPQNSAFPEGSHMLFVFKRSMSHIPVCRQTLSNVIHDNDQIDNDKKGGGGGSGSSGGIAGSSLCMKPKNLPHLVEGRYKYVFNLYHTTGD